MIKHVKIWPRMAVYSLTDPQYDYFVPSILADLPPNDGIRLISINGSNERFLTQAEEKILRDQYNFTFIRSYRFDDIDGDIWESIVKSRNIDRSSFILFNDEMARDICDFALSTYEPVAHYEESDELLIVHCHAGISRSSAVGSALAYHWNLDPEVFASMNPNIDPNKSILTQMLETLGHSKVGFNSWRNSRKRFS